MLIVVIALFIIYTIYTFYAQKMYSSDLTIKRWINVEYYFLSDNVLTRKSFSNVYGRLDSLSIFTAEELVLESILLWERSIVYSTLTSLLVLSLVNTFEVVALALAFPIVFFEVFINKKLDSIYAQILKDLSRTVQNIAEKYSISHNLSTALRECYKSKNIAGNIDGIYSIINSHDPTQALEEFNSSMPIPYIRMLATMCYIIEDRGDIKNEKGGSVFISELTVLRQEIDAEILRIVDTKNSFKGTTVPIILAFVLYKGIEILLSSSMPAYLVIMQSSYGALARAGLFIVSIIAFIIISNLMRPSVAQVVDRSKIVYNIAKNVRVRKFLEKYIIPQTYREKEKWDRIYTESMSSQDLVYTYTSKIAHSIIIAIFLTIVVLIATRSYREYIIDYYGPMDANNTSIAIEKRYVPRMKEIETRYIRSGEKENSEVLDKALEALGGPFKLKNTREATINRIQAKFDAYHGSKFNYRYSFIIVVISLLAWFVPNLKLKFRKFLLSYEVQEDVLQLQTLMIILHHTNMDAREALYWMHKQSTIHRYQLLYAYHDYTAGPEEAIERLIFLSNNTDLKILLQKLKAACFDISLTDSFADSYLDKEHSLQMRTRVLAENLKVKNLVAKTMGYATLVFSGLMFLAIPLGMILLNTISEALKNIN